ncbi:MAG: glycosyltransferase family 4 protein [Ruminococcaceae bacterium]|nr:glycosyltransferase family 4 protein [Oscillospiraceae bacterium]
MRVCVVVLNSIWYDPRVRKQINGYLENGVDVVGVGYKCKRYNEEKVGAIPCPVTIVEPDPHYVGHQRSPIKKIRREVVRDQRLCDAIVAHRPDVIHANDLDTLAACVKAAKRLKCRLVYDSHEICVENQHMKGWHKRYAAWTEKRCIRKIDHMVCVSHAAADYFTAKYGITRPMVVTNCSLLSERATADSKHDGFEMLNHGQYYAGRGYDIMVEAIPLLRDYPEIKIALRGFGVMEEALRARAAELGNENVRFYPPVLVQELIPSASTAHVGVAITENTCLNFRLSVSNKLFEYASAGLPVIMSDIPEHRYLNEKFQFGIVISENTPEAFAKAALRLYTDRAFYNACAEGSSRMTEEVNWECEFARLVELERSWVNGAK